jgi:Uma2 family endonuclease
LRPRRPEPRLFTVEEYHRMGEAGILGEDSRVELIEGQIIRMNPISPLHAGRVNRLTELLWAHFSGKVIVRVQNPVRASHISEPQPDLCLLRLRADYYEGSHPEPSDVFLLIEVADSSLEYDRSVKASLYAATGMPELWIVDLNRRQLESFRVPGPDGYSEVRTVSPGEHLAPLAFPEVALAVRDILGG